MYYVVVIMSVKTPSLIIRSIKNNLVSIGNHLKEDDYRMALLSFVEIKGAVAYAENILRSLIFQESNRDLIHKPTLDRLTEWIKKYQVQPGGIANKTIVCDTILEQIELMKDE